MRTLTLTALLALGTALPALAQTSALILGTEDYDAVSDVRRGDEVADARDAFEDADVRVFAEADADTQALFGALNEFAQAARQSDGLLVALSGRFVHSSTETYYLPSDIDPQPLAGLAGAALPLSTVLAYLAEVPGRAVLALGSDDTTGTFSPYLQIGIGRIDIPQGVTIVTGEPRPIARFLRDGLSRPGQNIRDAAQSARVDVSGFLAADQVFIAELEEPAAPEADTSADERQQDLLAWRAADSTNTAEAYEAYLSNYPDGQFRRMAEARIEALTDTPEARAERTEQALDLDRDARREIQRDLSLLDYNTRGIDGIFGRGTRAAIGLWQTENGFDSTGFLTRDQITRLDAQAERRAAELEEEAERRREEQLAADRAFWEETGSVGDEAGLRVYLERFPDGEYAEVARARLDEIEAEKRAETDARDRQLWDEAKSEDTAQAYRDYLDLAPGGAFRDEAAERIAELEREASQSDEMARAEAEEQALQLTPTTRRIIENRLDRLGLKPGRVDGQFDDDTRRAIRRYQAARDLPETGYLNEATVVQILADSVRSVFR